MLKTIGADPELFVSVAGKPASMAGVLGFTKKNKLVLDSKPYRFQEDNVLLEFDIDPCESFTEFSSYLSGALHDAKIIAQEHGMDTMEICSHIYTEEELAFFDESAFVFGCDADYNVLTGRKNRIPRASKGLRSAGGHVHLGFDKPDFHSNFLETQRAVGISCDYFLGLLSVILDKDRRRREIYGKAGAVRFKEYGIEYRTLSNFWVFDPETRLKIYESSKLAVEVATTKGAMEKLLGTVTPEEVQRAINEGDELSANKYIDLIGSAFE